jgi:hypothetical protein
MLLIRHKPNRWRLQSHLHFDTVNSLKFDLPDIWWEEIIVSHDYSPPLSSIFCCSVVNQSSRDGDRCFGVSSESWVWVPPWWAGSTYAARWEVRYSWGSLEGTLHWRSWYHCPPGGTTLYAGRFSRCSRRKDSSWRLESSRFRESSALYTNSPHPASCCHCHQRCWLHSRLNCTFLNCLWLIRYHTGVLLRNTLSPNNFVLSLVWFMFAFCFSCHSFLSSVRSFARCFLQL